MNDEALRMSEPFLDFYRDTCTSDVFIWAGHDDRCVRLRFLDSKPGDPDGVLVYDWSTFLRLVRRGVLAPVGWEMITD